MKAILLAAGQGVRLRPLTDDRPKCLVELGGLPLLDLQLAALRGAEIEDVTLVGGYRAELLGDRGHPVVVNPEYASTNMVASLFCARNRLRGSQDVLIAYTDIVYETRLLAALACSTGEVSVAVDRGWRAYWEARMEDPLRDAETLKLDPTGNLRELGKKPRDHSEIEGQYIGLIKIRADRLERLCEAYDRLDREAVYDGKSFPNMFMTSFLQHLIETGWPVQAVLVEHGWLEVDTLEDLELYGRLLAEGRLDRFYASPLLRRAAM
ncbi:MAG: phosphocholine cytidylyltransferase family protein [Armatimonadetes bacterium]|nr:phosphocholine cytidylyltransferase family protein [Armatimonadota bacterium]